MLEADKLKLENIFENGNIDDKITALVEILTRYQSQEVEIELFRKIDNLAIEAIKTTRTDVIEKLLKNIKDVNVISSHSVIATASIIGNLNIIRFIYDIEPKLKLNGWTAMNCASQKGHWHIVEYLVEKGIKEGLDDALTNAIKKGAINAIQCLIPKEVKDHPNTIQLSIAHSHYHIADLLERVTNTPHVTGEKSAHDVYKENEALLLKNVNPLVYKVDLSKIQEYAELSADMKGVYKFKSTSSKGKILTNVPDDVKNLLLMELSPKYFDPMIFNMDAAMRLNFPTKEEIEKVTLDGSPLAKVWIALLEKNQVATMEKS